MALIQVKDLTFGYDGNPDNVFEHVTFQMDTNWKLGFIGRNGRGKTTFLRLLLGEYPYRGTISCPVPVAYFPFPVPHPEQDTQAVVEALAPEYELWRLQRELSLLRVDAEVLDRPFCTLSNGEQTKVLLAALFLDEGHAHRRADQPSGRGGATPCRYLNGKGHPVSHDRTLPTVRDHIRAQPGGHRGTGGEFPLLAGEPQPAGPV
ncbi:MAG: ATP-binding cassette domain-containing protein [Anaeromassilibacillus sp.]